MMKEDTVLTPASSTPPSDAEVIARTLRKAEWLRVHADDDETETMSVAEVEGDQVRAAPDLARRLQAALTRISTLERELGASNAAYLNTATLLSALASMAQTAEAQRDNLLREHGLPPARIGGMRMDSGSMNFGYTQGFEEGVAHERRQAEAVAAKSREEALEEAAREADKVAGWAHEALKATGDEDGPCSLDEINAAWGKLRADRSQPPDPMMVTLLTAQPERRGATRHIEHQGRDSR